MKGVLEFNLPEEREEFETAQKGVDYKLALETVWNQVFRPYYKHGYTDSDLQKLVESTPEVGQAIDKLKELYLQVLNEYGVNE
jgi:hypothetical protein